MDAKNVADFVQKVLVATNMHHSSGAVRAELEAEIARTYVERLNSARVDAMGENDVELVQTMFRQRPEIDRAAIIEQVTSRIPGIDRLLVKVADDLLWEIVDNVRRIDAVSKR